MNRDMIPEHLTLAPGAQDLLEHIYIEPSEIDTLSSLIPCRVLYQTLDAHIGKGVSLRLAGHFGYDDMYYMEVTFSSPDSFLTFPIAVNAKIDRRPDAPEDHNDYCPFSVDWNGIEDPDRDEYGNLVFYDWSDNAQNENDWDCNCDWVEVATGTDEINDMDDLERIRTLLAYLAETEQP